MPMTTQGPAAPSPDGFRADIAIAKLPAAKAAPEVVWPRQAPQEFAAVPRTILRLSGVYVARHDSFEVTLGGAYSPDAALDLLFRELPLAEHGWERAQTRLEPYGMRSWKVSRT